MVSASMRTSPMHHWHGGMSMSLSPRGEQLWLRRQPTFLELSKQKIANNRPTEHPLIRVWVEWIAVEPSNTFKPI